jgi:hypothetical protein
MPDWNNMSQDNFNKAYAALPLPDIQASISISRYNVTPHRFIPYLISYPISYLIYVNLISYLI